MLLPLIFLISGYFSVHNVKAVKIYFPGSRPVNILIHIHDRQAFMAVAERLKLYFSKKYISCEKSGSPRSCCIKLTEKNISRKKKECKEGKTACHSLVKFCYILKVTFKSHPIYGHF